MGLLLLWISSVCVSFVLIQLLSSLFSRWNLLDKPHKYGYKRAPIPYSMGVIFFINFLIISTMFAEHNMKLLFLIVFGTIVTVMSFFDDFYDISPKLRLFFQILIGGVIGLAFVKTGYLSTLFWGLVNLNVLSLELLDYKIFVVPILFTIVWYVTIFNSLNWSDGIPWLTSGLSFVSFLVIFLLWVKLYFTDTYSGGIENAIFIMEMSLAILTSVGLFWWFDVREKMLMGDSGTMFLGFMLASLAIISGGKIATVVVVFWVYLIDAFYVIFKRLLAGKSPMNKDFSHLHHRLLQAGMTKKQILTFIYAISFFFGVTSLFLETQGKIIVFMMLVFIVVFVNSVFDFVHKVKKKLK